MENIIVGIDVGTSKVCTIIGRVDKDNQIDILGKGIESCSGVKKGVIVDIESTAVSIKNSVERAENMANLKVKSAYVNIMGTHVSILNNKSYLDIMGENREIKVEDVDKALYSTKNVVIPDDRKIIDIIPRQYIVDGYDEIKDPIGMVGSRLEVEADIVAGKITSVQNIVKSLERADIRIDGIVIEALATGDMALSVDEKDMGVILIDIGGGITDISVFKKKNLLFYDSIPVGGDHITNDISIGLKIPYAEADRIKKEYAIALTSLIKNDQDIVVSDINGSNKKDVKVSEVVEIIEARIYEIFSLCKKLLDQANLNDSFRVGVVLTGGGIVYFDGCREIGLEILEMPVNLADYRQSEIDKVEYATAAGIVKYISRRHKGSDYGSEIKIQKQKTASKEFKLFDKISRIFRSLF